MARLKWIALRNAGGLVRAALLVAVLGAKYATCTPDDLDCLHATRATNDGLAAVICEREYARTQAPETGARLANVLRRSGKPESAEALANALLATSARADALAVLGKIALDKDRLGEALDRLQAARALHFAELQLDKVAADDQSLAGIFQRQKRFAEALRALGDCIAEAAQSKDRLLEGYCHLSAGMVLGEVGYFEGAQAQLALSEPMLVRDRDLAELEIERGGLLQHHAFGARRRDENRFAILHEKRAIEYARRAARTPDELTAELNLVYSLAEVGETSEAAIHLERARILDVNNEDVVTRATLEARIAYRAGNGALASSINSAVYDQLTEDDIRLKVSAMQARIALAANNLELAKTWASRGVEVAEQLRRGTSAVELRPWMLSLRREPYELLFAAQVRSRQFDDALVTFDHWQARTLLDSSARDRHGHVELKTAAGATETYHKVFPILSLAPVMQPIDRDELRKRMTNVDLIALVVADDEIWRIESRHGLPNVVRVGAFAALQPVLAQFAVTPTRIDLAESLGVKLLGAEAFRDTHETLFIVLDGQLAGIPLAALRAGGHPLIARRTVVRAPRLSELGCRAPRSDPRHAVVLADARNDLQEAAQGAAAIAARFGVTPAIGDAATSRALFAAGKDDILHVVVHASIDAGVGTLLLHDRALSALEIAAHGESPALVVLSACVSAVSDDGEQATSLANAFLAAGADQVVATLRPVTVAGARELTQRFYAAGGAGDPARTLARVQAALAASSAHDDWPNFVLLGHDTCRKEPP